MSTPHDTPLWLKIRNHPSLFCLHPTPQQIGTIFRVIADDVLRETPKPSPGDGIIPGGSPKRYRAVLAAWEQRMSIRDLLLAEAERAEVAQ
jgi:hypothetical protein